MTTASQHRLVLGDLDLNADYGNYRLETLADDASFGNPQPVEVAIASLLADGAIASTTRHDNREAFFRVLVSAGDGTGLAEGEAALVAQLARRNELAWTPPAGWGPTTVFEVATSSLTHTFDDQAELRLQRAYGVRLVCLPWGRSVGRVVTPAVAEGTPTVVDAMDSATGWTAKKAQGYNAGPVPVTVDSTVYATAPAALMASAAPDTFGPSHEATIEFTRAGSFSMAGDEYLAVQTRTEYPGLIQGLSFVRGGTRIPSTPVSSTAMPGGWVRSVFYVGDGTIADVQVSIRQSLDADQYGLPASMRAWVDDLQRVSASGGTVKQSSRLLDVVGSVRTPGSLQVSHPTSALGDVLVYTRPDHGDGYRPDLRRWRTSGPAVSDDTAAVSGKSETLRTSLPSATKLTVPAASIAPGAYALMARVKASVSSVLYMRVSTVLNGVTLASTAIMSATVASTEWARVILDTVLLPNVTLPAETAANLLVEVWAQGTAVIFDEAWLFGLDGVLTEVACGTSAPSVGGSANRLWIDNPTIDRPTPAVWVGTQADRSDAWGAGPVLQGGMAQHQFSPPVMTVFVATSNAAGAEVTLSHYPRWHTHAAV